MFTKYVPRLTFREREVLQFIANGAPHKHIAEDLAIRIETVEKHCERLMAKLEIYDNLGLTRYAMRRGMIASRVKLTIVEPRTY